MAEFHFLRVWWLLAFIPLLALMILLFKRNNQQREWQKVCDPHLFKHVMCELGTTYRFFTLFLAGGVGSLIIVALAGPAWNRLPEAAFQKQQGTVIVLDLSKNMLAQDLSPNRLIRAKFKIQDILKKMKEGQVGMVVYSGEPFVVSPITDDSKTIASMMPQIITDIMPLAGSDTGSALRLAAKLIKQAGFNRGNIILLIASPLTKEDIGVAQNLAKNGINTSVLGVGTALGAPIPLRNTYLSIPDETAVSRLDIAYLEKLAKKGGGKYITFSEDDNDVKTIMALSTSRMQAQTKVKEKVALDVWQDEGRKLLFFVIPFVLYAFRRGWLESINA